MTIFRPAHETDLRAVYEVFYQNEVLDSPHPPSPGDIPSYLRHVLQTGTLYVAEQEGEVLAFAGAITRGNITFLTDLFVQPVLQSGQLGKTLLHSVLAQDDLIHCTVSSSDPRALALYIRAGMRPQWPYFALRLEKSTYEWRLTGDMEIVEAAGACVLSIICIGYVSNELSHCGSGGKGGSWAMDIYGWAREHSGILKLVHLDRLVRAPRKMRLLASWLPWVGPRSRRMCYASMCRALILAWQHYSKEGFTLPTLIHSFRLQACLSLMPDATSHREETCSKGR